MNNACSSIFCLDQKGFTIVEIMIGLVILVIGLLSLASLQLSAIKGNHLSDNITTALALSEDKMEELLGLNYDNPELQDLVTSNNHDLRRIDPGWIDRQEFDIGETGKENTGSFRRIWNIADNRPIENNKTISVIVLWDNDKHRLSLTSVKRR